MADRSVKVRLEANVDGFKAGMRTAAQAVQDFDKKATGWIDHNRASINDLSNTALGLGAGLLAGAGLAAKAAMDWESAWTGVLKTVDGTDAQLARLEDDLRSMARTLPASHAEIAAVAEAAGQLGVATDDVADFTRTMINLGESTNMSAEEAATSLARFMTITGTTQDRVGDLGASVVGLGNSFAATESEIVSLGMRLAGAGVQAGLSEGEIMGMAAAMSQVGIEAEAGGSAMSLTMKRIGKSVEEGGDSLDLFAKVSGMTADEFATAWQTRPAEALTAFVEGLGRTEQLGMSTNAVLSELGITGIRESDALLRLSSATGVLSDAMAMGNQEFADGTALIEEASKRYETAESRISMAKNAIVDAAIEVGGGLAPALAEAADMVAFLASKFSELPGPAKAALGYGAGIAGLSLIAVGGIGKLIVGFNDARGALSDLGITSDRVGGKLNALGATSVIGVSIIALTTIIGGFVRQAAEAEAASVALADAFDGVTGAANENADFAILEQLNEHISASDWEKLNELGYTYQDFIDAIKAGGPQLQAFKDQLKEDWSGEMFFSGERDALSKAVGGVKAVGDGYEQAADQASELAKQQNELGTSAESSAAAQEILEGSLVNLDGSIKDTNESLREFMDLLFEAGLRTMSARDAQAAYHESVDEVGTTVDELIEKHGGLGTALNDAKTDFDLTTEAGRTANSAFQDVARSGMDVATSMAEAGASQDEIQGKLSTTYDDLILAAGQLGITGDAAEDLARDVMGIPDGVDIDTWMDDEAERQAQATQRAIDGVDRSIRVTTTYVYIGKPPSGGNVRGTQAYMAEADGGVIPTVRAFANGGEHHVAQIAPAGAWRLWAEPETGGEAYIPLAASKRARSERILADVAARFGMGLEKYGNGGMVMPYEPSRGRAALPAGGMTFSPTFHNYNTDAVRSTREQVAQFGQKVDSMAVPLTGG